ncbi:MAG: dTDP-4-dehydrorhamnose reductase [Polaromonas sp.]|jgi:dTDP-4-dehydrorhamnose reductase|nr:dTDP-4-dehydrorhamnose reductase [Polaromonas sp.]
MCKAALTANGHLNSTVNPDMKVKKIVLLGAQGQVGWELRRSLASLGDVLALDRSSTDFCGDISNLAGLAQTIRQISPHVIVNAAAYTAVDRAETEAELANTVNALAPGVLAQEASKLGALLVHYSTDYVFDGSGAVPWMEADATSPLSVYGQTKLEGEKRIQAACPNHLIFRTSWVYAARGGNFAKTMLRLAQEREQLTVIDDQFGAPTGADLLADVTAHAIRQLQHQPADTGLYHLAAAGETSWNGYARHVLAHARQLKPDLQLKATDVKAVPSSAFVTAAVRPLNSRLNTTQLQSTFCLKMPRWEQGVERMLAEVL